jgi:anti-sigma-K factor RskA
LTETALIAQILCGIYRVSRHSQAIFRRDEIMRAFLLAAVAVVVLATGTAFVLERFQEPTAVALTTSGARIDR